MSKTLYDKIWQSHLINEQDDGTSLIYIDRHLVHEVTSPQAFEGLRLSNRKVNSPKRTLAVADHNVPTLDRELGIKEEDSRIQVEELDKNVEEFQIPYFNMNDTRQGIVHVIGPEQGFTQLSKSLFWSNNVHNTLSSIIHVKIRYLKFFNIFIKFFNLNTRVFFFNS